MITVAAICRPTEENSKRRFFGYASTGIRCHADWQCRYWIENSCEIGMRLHTSYDSMENNFLWNCCDLIESQHWFIRDLMPASVAKLVEKKGPDFIDDNKLLTMWRVRPWQKLKIKLSIWLRKTWVYTFKTWIWYWLFFVRSRSFATLIFL